MLVGAATRRTATLRSRWGSRTARAGLVGTVVFAVAGASVAAASPTSRSELMARHARAQQEQTSPKNARGAQVVVQDIKIRVPGQDPVAAWLVQPASVKRHAAAGILWLHWLGEIHNDRSEFLAEAIELADEGVVSLLPQGFFPWVPDPVGDERDVAAVRAQVDAFRACLRKLEALRSVDSDRIAIVGHDYGAMYGALLADEDPHVSAMVMAAPDALWGNWFATFWLGLEGEEKAAYEALFKGLDPVEHAGRLGSHVLIQWAGEDFFIPAEVRDAYAAAAPEAQTILYPRVDHEFTTRAQIDRTAFLRAELGLG
jgi:dienelactone hydrolase